jgi:predicted ArsR family transcriptional regulator
MSERTREYILEYLIKYHTATTAELSETLHFTKENIRHHLNILKQEGIVELFPIANANKTSPGRPSLVYHFTITSQPGNMVHLATALFHAYMENLATDAEKLEGLKKLAQILFPSSSKDQKPSQLYNKSIQLLNQHSYQASWEARKGGPLFSFRNCPYAACQSDQPELCLLDTFILENLLGAPIRQITKINPKGKSPAACTFILNSPLG